MLDGACQWNKNYVMVKGRLTWADTCYILLEHTCNMAFQTRVRFSIADTRWYPQMLSIRIGKIILRT